MQEVLKLGVWMDHAEAHFLEYSEVSKHIKVIYSTFDKEEYTQAINKGEHLMHNKRQQYQANYYKKIGDELSNYKEVILFGPTEAKYELLNLLKSDIRFENTPIKVQVTDKMTDNQKQAFVNDFFS